MVDIILIEDSPMITALLVNVVEGNQLSLMCADTVDEGIKLLKNHPPKVIILDLMLPGGKSGQDFLKENKKEIGDAIVIVIVMTTSDDKKVKEECLKLGAKEFISKPFKYSKFEDLILKYIKKNKSKKIIS